MLIDTISSRQNPLVKRMISVRDGRERHLIFVEGARLVQEAIDSRLRIETVMFTYEFSETEKGKSLLETLQALHCRGAVVPEKLMAGITGVETPQGIALLASRPYASLEDVLEPAPQLLVLADGLQDPGNLGALVRTAEAAGVTGLITSRQTADPFQPKALRASAGSAFRLPIATHIAHQEIVQALRGQGIKVVTAAAKAPLHFSEYDWKQPTVLWLGSEGNGLPEDVAATADAAVFIPMAGAVESLNITVATALLLFEAVRQRKP
ncbi:MAG: RNA methyltransferase [Blastocatellia bacterium]|nr:RNA methyltransferase [Blastocatellia bacterium]